MRPLLLSLCSLCVTALLYAGGAATLAGKGPLALAVAAQAQQGGLSVVSASGRKPLRSTIVNDHEMVAAEDLAALFQLSLREDALAGALTIGFKGKSVIVMADQAIASVGASSAAPGGTASGLGAGRLVSLPAPVVRDGRRWLLPVEVVGRALALIYDTRLEYRPASHLVVVGDLRVPRLIVRQEVQGNQARVTFDTVPRTAAAVVQDQGRLLVRFEADALDASLAAISVPGLAETARVVEPGNTVAIVLGPRFASFRASTPPGDAGSARLIVDLLPALPASGAPSAQTPATPAPPGTGQTEVPLLPSQPTLRTIAIDPGHGGNETGARGPSGVLEKDVTLNVARRLKGLLESRLGVRALLTRDADTDVTLDERASLANNNKADLFVSIHANASVRKDVKGAQIFYLSPDDYANAQGAARPTSLPTFNGGSRDIDVIPWEVAQTHHLGESAELAGLVEAELRSRVPMVLRPVQQAPLRVLVGANMPAVLVELGFLTNAEQEQALGGGEFQATIAQALFDAVVRFKDVSDRSRAISTTNHDPGAR